MIAAQRIGPRCFEDRHHIWRGDGSRVGVVRPVTACPLIGKIELIADVRTRATFR